MTQKLNYYTFSQKGWKTPTNQDSFAVPEKKEKELIAANKKDYFFTVCDGVGGHQAGDVASRICAKGILKDYYQAARIDDPETWLEEEIIDLNTRIFGLSRECLEYSGMATTLVTLLITEKEAFINNVGDSRVYIYTEGKLDQITEDHSLVWEYLVQGLITKDEILFCREKNIITEGMGLSPKPRINNYRIKLPEKYVFLLCSDGLTDVIFDAEIEAILFYCKNLKESANILYALSQKNGSYDDVTIVLVSNFMDTY